MGGAYIADQVAAVLAEHGESTMTLQRPGGATVTFSGKRFRQLGAGSDKLIATAAQNEIRIKMSNAEIAAAAWPGPPRKGDRLTMGGRSYVLDADADTRWDGDTIAMHILLVKG